MQATKAAKEEATGKYLACLFLLLADNKRYSLLKTQLDNKFLMGARYLVSGELTLRLKCEEVPVMT